MNIQRRNDNDLADMAANIVELLSGDELEILEPQVRARLIEAAGNKPSELAELTTAAATIDGEKKAAFSAKGMSRSKVVEWTRQVRDSLKAARAPKTAFDLCGFDFPAQRSSVYTAQDPTNLAGVGFSNGVNHLEFIGNNPPALVFYEIWRREGMGGAWHQHDFTKKQKYNDTGATPGQYYEYRVRSRAARTTSNFSNTTVVYGVL